MKAFRKFESALRSALRDWTNTIGEVDILVGIPCFNNEDTIAHVVQTAAQGVADHFPGRPAVILVSDGGSLDDTRERAESTPIPPGIQRHVTIYRGIPGKGTSLRAVFEAATQLKASACVVVDSDLRSITPEWVKLLAEPILNRQADYVTPYYIRHKYDGTITNHIVYPMVRALYGRQVRQPIGGDFGFSGELAAFYVREDVWDSDVARFGIDIWMTTTAIAEDFKVAQTHLGTKIHDAKDPGTDLGPMFTQVVGTLLYVMGRYENRWMRVEGSTPVDIIGEAETVMKLEPLAVSLNKLKKEFHEGFNHFSGLYRQVLDPTNFGALREVVKVLEETDEVKFPADLWARILYDFAFIFQLWNRNRRRLVSMLVPLYFGRTAAYCQEVAPMEAEEAEQVVEAQAAVFEREKPYLRDKLLAWTE